jgi:hypothetical protein
MRGPLPRDILRAIELLESSGFEIRLRRQGRDRANSGGEQSERRLLRRERALRYAQLRRRDLWCIAAYWDGIGEWRW